MSIQRFKAQIGVTLLGRGQSHTLLTESVSPTGMFIRSDAPPPTMSLLRVQVDLPLDGKGVAMHGMVASTSMPESAYAAPGMEIVFFAANGAASARWDRFIEYVRRTHPESRARPVLLSREAAPAIERCAAVPNLSASDVTPRGMFLPTKLPLAVGADVCVSVLGPGSMTRLDIDGIVRRRTVGGRDGLGIEYRNMTAARWSELSAFLRIVGTAFSLSAEVRIVRTPQAPPPMATLAGPWQSADDARGAEPRNEASWTLPPGTLLDEPLVAG